MKLSETEQVEVSWIIVAYKLISGAFELILGTGIVFFGNRMLGMYTRFRNEELLEDPHDLLVRVLGSVVPMLVEYRTAITIFLFILGATKIIGAIGLLKKKEWGLDLLIALFLILLPFDLYSLAFHFTVVKLLYFIVNTLIALFLMEFRPHKYVARLKKYVHKPKRDAIMEDI
ncbi:DUF2127 domain-containing protein [Patescibacteria group bacterium]|nr:DUF2127 domain-containing protein [Patescibacteria group bacterium]